VMSFPLLVSTMRVAFENVSARLELIARTLGASPWRVFATITLPLAARGLVAGAALAFARALGEFGATIMLSGYIPGKTATLALSIHHLAQLGQDREAMVLLGISIAIAFAAVWLSGWFMQKRAS
jgi:molybdate transport system permease protein